MDKAILMRTAAIIYADESSIVSTKTIARKIIEAILVENNNEKISVHTLIDSIKEKLGLIFYEEEVIEIINSDKEKCFEIDFLAKEKEHIVNLCLKRFNTLKAKAEQNSIDNKIIEFYDTVYKGSLKKENIELIIFRFLYEILNKNLASFIKLTNPKCNTEEVAVDTSLFSIEQRKVINDFLTWEDTGKNKAIFALISYSIEYSLISNNIKSSDLFADSLKRKEFYLDNNVIYRAIGINGENRKKRIRVFLKKCIDSGQKLCVSKYTINEFKDTINHHINQLQRVPFTKINPRLFSQYALNPGFYEFYHEWRKNRSTFGFGIFHSHLISLYKNFIRDYNITEDYRISYDEKDEKIKKTITKYSGEIKLYKENAMENTLYFDAINTFFVENKRGTNNKNLMDTKYYFISTDQKLRDWDFNRNDCQPIALLPSHWMPILLKYFSRSDDDFSSYLSFLGLRTADPMIDENQLQPVLAGISEITEDFDQQSEILSQMVEIKFKGILDNKDINETHSNAMKFAHLKMESKLKEIKKDSDSKIETIKKEYKLNTNNLRKEFLIELQKEIEDSIQQTEKTKTICDNETSKKFNSRSKIYIGIVLLYYLGLIVLTILFGWEIMEPIVTFLGLFGIVGSYIYLAIKGHSFNPLKFIETTKDKITKNVNIKYDFDNERLVNQQMRLKQIKDEISKI